MLSFTSPKPRQFRRGSHGTGCFRMKVRADAAEFTNMRIAGLRKWWDLIREDKMLIKNETKVACRISGIEWRVDYFRKLPFETCTKAISSYYSFTACVIQTTANGVVQRICHISQAPGVMSQKHIPVPRYCSHCVEFVYINSTSNTNYNQLRSTATDCKAFQLLRLHLDGWEKCDTMSCTLKIHSANSSILVGQLLQYTSIPGQSNIYNAEHFKCESNKLTPEVLIVHCFTHRKQQKW